MLANQLKRIGLSDKEARVYLSSLRLGKSPANDIAKQAGVNRATTYVIIESLIEKGLMTSYEQDDKAYFTAESPDHLMSLLKKQEQDIKEKEAEMNKILPELLSMYSMGDNKPKVKFYEGVEGLASVQEEYLKVKSKQTYNISYFDAFLKYMPNVNNEYTVRRVKKGIKGKLLYVTEGKPNMEFATDKAKLRETRYLSFSEFPFKSDITIFDNKVSLESYEDKVMGVLIENKGIADSMKAIFEFLWKKSDTEMRS